MLKKATAGVCLFSTLGLACGADGPDRPTSEPTRGADQSKGIRELDHDLALGSTGPDAAAVNGYLTAFGYFPNEELARKYPAWRPLVSEAPASSFLYDASTVEAVKKFQINNELPVTGVVDKATRELMKTPRCGVPDGIEQADSSNKYGIIGKYWGNTAKWYHDDWYSVGATLEMINKWAAVTNLAFVQTSDSPDITITWGNLNNTEALASTSRPAWYDYSADITVNTQFSWYMGSDSPPPGQVDYKTVILHELGHAIGLDHSSHGHAVMRGPYFGVKRDLTLDDKVGVSSMYDQWELMDTDTSDVGIGAAGDLWVVQASNHNVWKLDSAGWHNVGADAGRIAVGGNGWPYVTAGWGDGTIWYYNSATPGAGTWQQMSGGGCAKDIAAAPEGIGGNAVWVIGCGSGADTAIFKYSGSCGCWVQASGGGLAARISVDAAGFPWVATSGGGVFRRSSNITSAGLWDLVSSTPYASDIGIGPAPVPNGNNGGTGLYWGGHYPWITTTSQTIHVLNKQPQINEGNPLPPERNEWRQLAGYAVRVAVGPNADPWVVDAQNRLWKTQK